MVGVVAAVRHWMTINHEERLASIEERSGRIIDILGGIEGVEVSMIDNIMGHQPFGVQLQVDEKITGVSLQSIVDKLKAGDPPIWTRVRENENFIAIHIFGLKEGQEEIVGSRIAELLR